MKNPCLLQFQIGDKVIINGEFRTSYTGGTKKVPIKIVYKHPKFGIICGATHKCLGTYKDYNYDPEYDSGEAPYLSVEKVITVWQVKLGLLNNPINCLAYQLGHYYNKLFKIPIRHYANKA